MTHSATHTLRVALVGFDAAHASRLVDGLPADGDVSVVAAAGDAAEAVGVVEQMAPDIALLDVDAPALNLVELTRRLALFTRVVALAEHEDQKRALASLRAGAAGYLDKELPSSKLRAALRGVARGEAAVSRSLTGALLDRLHEAEDAGDLDDRRSDGL